MSEAWRSFVYYGVPGLCPGDDLTDRNTPAARAALRRFRKLKRTPCVMVIETSWGPVTCDYEKPWIRRARLKREWRRATRLASLLPPLSERTWLHPW